jgi:uncharacterized membrane protein YbhN (UPF0104 family)
MTAPATASATAPRTERGASPRGDAADGPARKAPPPGSLRSRPWWPYAKRIVTWVFFVAVAWLIFRYARTIDWADVLKAMLALPPLSVALGIGLTTASYLLYSTYDLLGRHMLGHKLRTTTVMGVTFVCYAFNLNLGSLVGSVALRYRLYSRLGLENEAITKVIGFSMLTNWFGYLAIAGAAFCFGGVQLPPDWKIDSGQLRIVGVVLMLLAAGYLVTCGVAGERVWHVRGREFETPSLRMGLLQLAISVGNWALMGAVMWVLMPDHAHFLEVLAVLLVAAVAGLISHVPAGLGVLEAVFLALLGHRIQQGPLLGSLLAYRAVYYVLPLLVASVFYLTTELRARKLRRESQRA